MPGNNPLCARITFTAKRCISRSLQRVSSVFPDGPAIVQSVVDDLRLFVSSQLPLLLRRFSFQRLVAAIIVI